MNTRMSNLSFRAMGTDCQILVAAPAPHADRLAELGRMRVDLLERCWSRFQVDSELSQLNASAGHGPRQVSADLLDLVVRMDQAWRETDGLFDPTVLNAVNALGYDVDFAQVAARVAADAASIPSSPAPGMADVVIDVASSTVSLPAGIGIDPGAIGKGLAADLIAADLHAAGADAVLVNLGGDIAVAGQLEVPWLIAVTDERLPRETEDRTLQLLELRAGTTAAGVATSTTLKRRWAQGTRHHVIDPRTGGMAQGPLVQVTVEHDSACTAEVLATAALLMEPEAAAAWLQGQGASAVLLTHDTVITTDTVNTRDTSPDHDLEALHA